MAARAEHLRARRSVSAAACGLAVAAALLVGLAAGAAFRSGPPPAGSDTRLQALADRVEGLEAELDAERRQRDALSERLAALIRRIDGELGRAVESGPAPGGAAPEARPGAARSTADAERAREEPPGLERLVEVGFSQREVSAYRSRIDQIELRRIELRDRATREGWVGTPEYAEASRELSLELAGTRDEFGDALYDWSLYSTGHTNRIRVSRVLESSPAAAAGIQNGDVIERYAEEAVLGNSDLRELSTSGEAGVPTPVDVRRGDDRLRLYLPRGPLGIYLEPIRQEPDPVR